MEFKMKKKIVVTGGAGFIGSHLCQKLIEDGNDVICVDNLFTGSKDNIRHLLNHPYFEFIRHDITEPLYIECDQIYNLACPASPTHYQHDPIQTFKTSVIGSYNMLGLAKRTQARILQASTSEIYGDPNIHPQAESYWGNVNPIGVRACYDEGKRGAETLFFDYHRKHNLEIRVVRIFNTFGPNMSSNDGRVISNFITQSLDNLDITIYGDGSQSRSFCYVDDLVTGLIDFMNQDASVGPINLGNEHVYSINELAKKIKLLTSSNSEIIYKSLPSDDPYKRKPDLSLAKKLINWNPQTTMDEALEKTILYFKTKI